MQSVEQRAGEQLGKARFAAFGKIDVSRRDVHAAPFLRQVKGYPMNGTIAPPMTTMYGLYDRVGQLRQQGPVRAAGALRGRTATSWTWRRRSISSRTNDIIGGNSGSPVINKNGEIVGLIFDGNIESLVGDFVYEGETNRAVAVHTAAITEALRKFYGAGALANELTGGK